MEAALPENPASFQGTQKDEVDTGTGTVDPKVEQICSKDPTGPPSDYTSARESEDLSRKEGQRPEQEEKAAVVDREVSVLERDDKKKETGATEQVEEKGKTNNEADLKSVRGEKEIGEKHLQAGEGEKKMKEKTEKKVRRVKERKGKEVVVAAEGDKKEMKKGLDLDAEIKELLKEIKEGGGALMFDGKEQEKQKKEKSLKNVEKVEEGKKEKKEKSDKKATDTSGQPEEQKKKEKKEKKSKATSERIQKKLEKINAKISRILAKKDEYTLRLKEAQEKERQESEKAALREREASTAVMGKSENDRSGSGLRREESVILDEYRSHHEGGSAAGDKQVERGTSGSLSRTISLIEGPGPEHFNEEVTGLKELVEDPPPNVLKSDGIEKNRSSQMEDAKAAMKGNGEVANHTLQVADSTQSGIS